jgi:hypothetical protein
LPQFWDIFRFFTMNLALRKNDDGPSYEPSQTAQPKRQSSHGDAGLLQSPLASDHSILGFLGRDQEKLSALGRPRFDPKPAGLQDRVPLLHMTSPARV